MSTLPPLTDPIFFHISCIKIFTVLFYMILFVLRLNVPVNIFSVMSGQSHRFLGNLPVLAQGHNTAAVGFEPLTSRSGVQHSTTEPPRSPFFFFFFYMIYMYVCMYVCMYVRHKVEL